MGPRPERSPNHPLRLVAQGRVPRREPEAYREERHQQSGTRVAVINTLTLVVGRPHGYWTLVHCASDRTPIRGLAGVGRFVGAERH
jgi:hypothetical protein